MAGRRRLAAVVAALASAALSLTACGSDGGGDAGGGERFELRFASYIGDTAPQSQSLKWWAEQIQERSDDRITVREFYNQSLLQAAEMLPGIAAGRADLGYLANAYFPGELPLTSVVEVPFTNDSVPAQSQALLELYRTDETYREEWRRQGAHVLYFPALGSNVLATKEPLRSLDDLRGKSIRGLGLVNEALQAVEVNAQAIAAPEIYESVQRGVIDGFSGYAYEVITSQKLQEVAPHLTDTGFGQYNASIIAMDLDVYNRFPDDLKKIVDDVSEQAQQRSVELLIEVEDQTCTTVKDSGGSVSRLPDADIERWKSTVQQKLIDTWTADRGTREFYDKYAALVAQHATEQDYVPGVRRCAGTG